VLGLRIALLQATIPNVKVATGSEMPVNHGKNAHWAKKSGRSHGDA